MQIDLQAAQKQAADAQTTSQAAQQAHSVATAAAAKAVAMQTARQVAAPRPAAATVAASPVAQSTTTSQTADEPSGKAAPPPRATPPVLSRISHAAPQSSDHSSDLQPAQSRPKTISIPIAIPPIQQLATPAGTLVSAPDALPEASVDAATTQAAPLAAAAAAAAIDPPAAPTLDPASFYPAPQAAVVETGATDMSSLRNAALAQRPHPASRPLQTPSPPHPTGHFFSHPTGHFPPQCCLCHVSSAMCCVALMSENLTICPESFFVLPLRAENVCGMTHNLAFSQGRLPLSRKRNRWRKKARWTQLPPRPNNPCR